MKPTKGNRAFGYIRVSSREQILGHSLEAQETGIRRWCEQNGYDSVRIFAEEGRSAHVDEIQKRPVLKPMLDAAGQNETDIVVVHTLDRWARKLSVQSEAFGVLGKVGVGFASVMENIDMTTPSGRLMLNTMGSINEFFSDQLGLHVRKALSVRAESGFQIGPVPFGYLALEPGGVAQVVECEAEAILQVYQRRQDGESTGSLANWLNDLGFKTRKGGIFTSHAVKDMLNCRFYVGKVCYNGEEYAGQHQPIINEELYHQVQARRQRRTIVRTVQGPKGLLQGIICCGNCGKGIQSDRHRFGGPMYRERHSRECDTNGRSIMAKTVDQQIEDILTAMELMPEWRSRMSQLAVEDSKGPDPRELQDKRRRLSVAFANGGFTYPQYYARLAEIDASLRLTESVGLPTLEEAAQLFEDIPQLWREATPEERRKLISPLIERVYVDMDCSMIGAIVPASAFRRLLEGAMARAESPAATLLSEDESERLKVWSWWRRGRAELPVQLKANAVRLWCFFTSHARCERIRIAYNPNMVDTRGRLSRISARPLLKARRSSDYDRLRNDPGSRRVARHEATLGNQSGEARPPGGKEGRQTLADQQGVGRALYSGTWPAGPTPSPPQGSTRHGARRHRRSCYDS